MKLEEALNYNSLIEEIKDAVMDIMKDAAENYRDNGFPNIEQFKTFESKNQPIAIDIYLHASDEYETGMLSFRDIEVGYIDFDFTDLGGQKSEYELGRQIEKDINSYFDGYAY